MSAIKKAITREELVRHCRRRTRGDDVTRQLMESLILQMTGATDSLGAPVLSARMLDIWQEEQKHVP